MISVLELSLGTPIFSDGQQQKMSQRAVLYQEEKHSNTTECLLNALLDVTDIWRTNAGFGWQVVPENQDAR